jgi:hypothetical protein
MFVKSRNLLLVLSLITILNYNSCKKYEDGPAFTLQTKKSRLNGTWELKEIEGNNTFWQDAEVIFEFEKDGDFGIEVEGTYTWNWYGYGYGYGYNNTWEFQYAYNGHWEWENNKRDIEIDYAGNRQEFEILKLTNKDLWLEDETRNEWKFEKM